MENNEIMNYEDIEIMDDEIVADGGKGIGTGIAMLIGAGLACAVGAGVKLGKNLYTKIKANRELKKLENGDHNDPEDLEGVAAK